MLNGFSLTDESTVVDLKAARDAGYAFTYIRARKVGKDDQKVTQNRQAASDAGLVYGTFFDMDYRPGQLAKPQAEQYAQFVRADDKLPPAVRIWAIDGVAVPAAVDFAKLLGEILYYIDIYAHRKGVVMANMSSIRMVMNALGSLSADTKDNILAAQWLPITWGNVTQPVLPAPLTKYPFWEYTDRTQNLPGVSGVALQKWPGTLAQLTTWANNPTLDNIPQWSETPAPEPEPEPDPDPIPVANGFEAPAIFSWNVPAIGGGNPLVFSSTLHACGVKSVYLKMADGAATFTPSGTAFPGWGENVKPELISALRSDGITPIGWQFVYGNDPVGEGKKAAELCLKYGLTEWIFDAESTFDGQAGASSKVTQLFTTFKGLCPNVKTAWCWWARFKSPSTGAAWHPVDVMRTAMNYADYGMPMMYWGDTAPTSLEILTQSLSQWREVTNKPIIPVGRAYTGDGGTINAVLIPPFADAVKVSCPGISWWVLDQAATKSDVMAALKTVGDGWITVPVPGDLDGLKKAVAALEARVKALEDALKAGIPVAGIAKIG